jgi:hypothetical protein
MTWPLYLALGLFGVSVVWRQRPRRAFYVALALVAAVLLLYVWPNLGKL